MGCAQQLYTQHHTPSVYMRGGRTHDHRQRRQVSPDTAENGWRIFPLRPGTKVPAIRDWEQRATTDLSRIERCWNAGPFNIGIACGPSGLVIVDLDMPKPGQQSPTLPGIGRDITCGADVFAAIARHEKAPELAETFTVRTGRSGQHLYYRAPGGIQFRNSTQRLGWLIDTRAGGGYVVGSGSVVAGKPYTVERDYELRELPSCLAARLRQPTPVTQTPRPVFAATMSTATRRDRYLAAALTNEVNQVRTAPEGQRNRRLYIAALRLGELTAGGHLDRTLVTDSLAQAGQVNGLSAAECEATIRSGLAAGERSPREVPA